MWNSEMWKFWWFFRKFDRAPAFFSWIYHFFLFLSRFFYGVVIFFFQDGRMIMVLGVVSGFGKKCKIFDNFWIFFRIFWLFVSQNFNNFFTFMTWFHFSWFMGPFIIPFINSLQLFLIYYTYFLTSRQML